MHICSVTGIALLPSEGHRVYRLAKPSFGPLNPRQRPLSSVNGRGDWNRYDIPGERTIYAATRQEAAYGELLGALKRPQQRMLASELFDDVVDDVTVDDLIGQDWKDAGKRLPPYVVDIYWLYEMRLYTVTLPAAGWLIDAEHSRTVTYLHNHIPLNLVERSIAAVTVSDLRSEDRYLTTNLAEQLARAQLEDHTVAVGVRYGSKHGSDWECWAVWLRDDVVSTMAADDGELVGEPEFNAALREVLHTYGLTVQ